MKSTWKMLHDTAKHLSIHSICHECQRAFSFWNSVNRDIPPRGGSENTERTNKTTNQSEETWIYGTSSTRVQIWSNMIKYDQIWSNMIKYVNIEIWSELDKSDNLDMVPDSNGHHRSWENIPAKGLYYVVFTGAKLIQLTTKVIWPVEYCAWTPGVGSRVF